MSSILQITQDIRDLLAPAIGNIKPKTFFSYYALFKDDVMFGLYKNGKLYLKLSPNAFEHTPWTATLERLDDPYMGIHEKHFYCLPETVLRDYDRYRHLIEETIQETTDNKRQYAQSRNQLIRRLPNLNINIERILRRLGIHTIEALVAKGEIAVFVELIKTGIEVDQTLLFKLYGAIHRQYIYTMSNKTKLGLLREANRALYDAGLRKRFNI